jgi:hypothetical protein
MTEDLSTEENSLQSSQSEKSPNESFSYERIVNSPLDIKMFEYGLQQTENELLKVLESVGEGDLSPINATLIFMLDDRMKRLEGKLSQLLQYGNMANVSYERVRAAYPAQKIVETGTKDGAADPESSNTNTGLGDPDKDPGKNLGSALDANGKEPGTVKTKKHRNSYADIDLEQIGEEMANKLKDNDDISIDWEKLLLDILKRQPTAIDKPKIFDEVEPIVKKIAIRDGFEFTRFEPDRAQRAKGLKTGFKYHKLPSQNNSAPQNAATSNGHYNPQSTDHIAKLGTADMVTLQVLDVPAPVVNKSEPELYKRREDLNVTRPEFKDPRFAIIEEAFSNYLVLFTRVKHEPSDLGLVIVNSLLSRNHLETVEEQDLIDLGIGRKEANGKFVLSPQEFAMVFNLRSSIYDEIYTNRFYDVYCFFRGVEPDSGFDEYARHRNITDKRDSHTHRTADRSKSNNPFNTYHGKGKIGRTRDDRR